MCNRMCIWNAVHADVCTRENVSSFSLRFTRLSIHSMDFDFGFARRFFWLRVFGLSDANASHRQAFISIEETHILNESTRHAYVTVIVHRVAAAMVAHRNLLNHFLCCLARCLSSLAAVDAATNTLLSLSTAEPISLWWSVCVVRRRHSDWKSHCVFVMDAGWLRVRRFFSVRRRRGPSAFQAKMS